MSSPDPLNDSTMAELASQSPSSATRRVTRSQSSQRLVSLDGSPRKQMVELQVGDGTSSKRLRTTAQLDGDDNVGSSARRKLFQSPASASSTPARQLRRRTTTTTVPLRESREEKPEDATTPRARGRQRKSNGTPMPGAGTKRRAATLVKRTPRRARTMASQDDGEPQSEPSVRTTPTPKKTLRPRKTPNTATSTKVGTDITPRASTARRGRRRRQALAPDELLELAGEVGDINLDTTQLPPVTSDDEVDLVRAPSESTDGDATEATDRAAAPAPAAAAPSSPSPATGGPVEPDSDIWMASISNEATPKAPAWTRDEIPHPQSSPHFAPGALTHLGDQQQEIETSQAGDYDGYGYGDLAGAESDGSSTNELLRDAGSPATMEPSAYDTIAHGEDFSMIFMESIQSLHPDFNSSVHPVTHQEFGEETSLIINNTLEALRQGADEGDPENDVDAAHLPDLPDLMTIAQPAEPDTVEEEGEEQPPEMSQEQLPSRRESTPARQSSSPPNERPSPKWSRSPRKGVNSSPLRHRVLKYSAIQAEEATFAKTNPTTDSPASPQFHQYLRNASHPEEGQPESFEDSFSVIPDAVLAAATPRRRQDNMTYDDLEDEGDQAQLDESRDEDMADNGTMQHEDESSGEVAEAEEDGAQEEQIEVVPTHGEAEVRYPDLPRIAAEVLKEREKQMVHEQDGLDDDMETDMIQHEQAASDVQVGQGFDDGSENNQSLAEAFRREEPAEPEAQAEVAADPEPSLFVADEEDEEEDESLKDYRVGEYMVDSGGDQQDSGGGEDVVNMFQEEAEFEEVEDAEDVEEDMAEQGFQEEAEVEEVEDAEDVEEDVAEQGFQEEAEVEEVEDAEEIENIEAVEEYMAEQGVQEVDDGQEQEEQEVDDGFDKEMADAMEAAVQAEEERAITAAASEQARLPTPDDTPPQVDIQTSDQAGYKSSRSSRSLSKMRSSPRSPGQFGGNSRIAAEQPVPSIRPSSRLASSPRYPGRIGDTRLPVAEKRHEEIQEFEIEQAEDDLMEDDDQMEHAQMEHEELGDEEMQDNMQEEEEEEEEERGEEDKGEADVHDPTVRTEPQPDPELGQPVAPIDFTRRSFDATPLNRVSSPLQEPQSLQHETSLSKTVRPHLSAIVRAGQVLQSITSDPPSPESREKQLGSPFRRPGSKDSWTGSRDSQTSRRTSRSPLQPRSTAAAAAKRNSPAQEETPDPFAATNAHTDAAFENSARHSVEPSIDKGGSPLRQSPASSMRVTPPSDGAMSWVAREGPISPNLRGDNSLREAAGLPEHGVGPDLAEKNPETFHKPVHEPVQEPVHETSWELSLKPREEADADEEIRDDDTDIWELEAQRETPRPPRQQSFGKRVAPSNQRRGAIPSPWTKKSIHRPATSRMISQSVPDLSHLTEEPSCIQDQAAQSSEPDEYSLLAQRQQEEEEAAKKASQAPASAVKDKRFDLSSFFSSPAAIPGMLAQKLMPKKSQPATQEPPAPMSMAQRAPPVVPTSSMFPQIPQKEFRPDSSARSDLFSPARRRQPDAATSPTQPQPRRQQQQQQQQEQKQQEEQEDEEEEQEEEEEEPPLLQQPQQQQPAAAPVVERCSSPATPEHISVPLDARKQNFAPRPRQTSQSFFQPSSDRSAAVTPPRMQLSLADIHRWTQQTSNASEASSDFHRPLLRPLPPRNASPTKSALRSPLKPHTPGRVVEFTSSVLSPAEQARARHDPFSHQPVLDPPNPDDDKENSSINDVSMEDAPPLPTQAARPLSQTTWTRRHWLLLDELLQLRRRQPFPIPYPRRADKYLGKMVKSHGESMALQQWHLDCVDAFKAEVGGWDEGVLAKRLFALILGEQKRKRKQRPMFH